MAAQDFTDRVLAPGAFASVEDLTAALERALSALERLVCEYHELETQLATLPQQRAWRAAKCVLVENGRRVKP